MKSKKEILLRLARNAIAEALHLPHSLDLERIIEDNPWLEEEGASFVTLTTENENLRGCIGSIVAHRKLYEDILHNAKSAALNDPRFPSLTDEEFGNITIEVSILTKPEVLDYDSVETLRSKIRMGIDGVILKYGRYQATFLPQVWTQLPSFDLFFSHLCQKAGLEGSCLQRLPEILTYEVQEYKEE